MTMTATVQTREPLPANIEQAIERVRRTLNRHVLIDAVLCGTGAAVAAGTAAVVLLAFASLPLLGAGLVACAAWALAAGWEVRRRWNDALDAALVLDRVLASKDRFSTALQFAGAAQQSKLQQLQIREAGTFLESIAAIPKAPRPAYRAGRYATVAVAALGIAVPIVLVGPELAASMREKDEPSRREAPRSAEEIAAAADALRARLRDDPDRRLDAEINALEHELADQRRRSMEDRATAIREAAEMLERAAGMDDETDAGAHDARASGAEAQSAPTGSELPRSVDEAPPETASRRLLDAWERARATMQAWREAASSPNQDPNRTAQLQQEAQQRQMEALRIARQEANWHASRSEEERAEERRLIEQRRAESETAGDRLQRSVERLDRALERLHSHDAREGLPPPEVGQALTRAAERLAEETPETARALGRAADAREQGDAERMDRALEQARRALRREAGAEPARFGDARRRLDELHDEVARRAAARGEHAGAQLAQNGLPGREGQHSGGAGQDGEGGREPNGRSGRNAQAQDGQESNGSRGDGQSTQAEHGGHAQQGQTGAQRTDQAGRGQQGHGQGAQGRGAQGQGEQSRGQGAQGDGAHGEGQQGQGRGAQGQGQQGHGQGAQGQGDGQGQADGHGEHGRQSGEGPASGRGQVGGGTGGGAGQGLGHGDGSAQLGGDPGLGRGDGSGYGQMPGGGRGQGGGGADTGTSERGSRSWGTGSGGDALGSTQPGGGGGHEPNVNVDPGGDPTQSAQLDPEARTRGMLPGAGHAAGHGGAPTDGASGGTSAPGSGELVGAGEDGRRVGGDSSVPASLRAYVRRYLERIRGGHDQ